MRISRRQIRWAEWCRTSENVEFAFGPAPNGRPAGLIASARYSVRIFSQLAQTPLQQRTPCRQPDNQIINPFGASGGVDAQGFDANVFSQFPNAVLQIRPAVPVKPDAQARPFSAANY